MTATQLGRVQLLIMQVLWQEGRATARDITAAINEWEPIAHSTVQTLLRGLEEKGSVAHEAQGRTFVFYALVAEDEFKQSVTRDLIDRVFDGSTSTLIAHLLKDKEVSGTELDEIRALINRRTKK